MSPPQPTSAAAGDWRDIEVPDPADLEPRERVTVVLDGDPARAGAAAQELRAGSYPAELLDVIAPGEARSPAGDVIVLLNAAARPDPGFVAAHARWHHAVADAVSLGSLEPPPEEEADEPLSLVRDLTRDLTDLAGGHHLAAAETSVGVRRELYEEAGGAGGAPPELRRLDLAHRLHCAGAVFVAEPRARAHGHAPGFARDVAGACMRGESLELRLPAAAALLALPPFRQPGSPRRHARAALAVNVEVGDAAPEEAIATVRGALEGELGDIELRVQVPEGHPGSDAIAAAVGGDPRASLAPSSLESGTEAPYQATVPAVAALDPRTLSDLHELALGEAVGALHVTIPGAAPQDAMIEVVATRARSRAARVADDQRSLDELIGRLFGERWVSGVEVSVRRHGVDEPQVTEHGPLAAATDLAHERSAHLRFRDRADDYAERARSLTARTLTERLRARAERQAAERVEARLDRQAPKS